MHEREEKSLNFEKSQTKLGGLIIIKVHIKTKILTFTNKLVQHGHRNRY